MPIVGLSGPHRTLDTILDRAANVEMPAQVPCRHRPADRDPASLATISWPRAARCWPACRRWPLSRSWSTCWSRDLDDHFGSIRKTVGGEHHAPGRAGHPAWPGAL